MATASDYHKWWDFFQSGNRQHETFIKWFSDHKDELPHITSMMSVGAGYGNLDAEIIKTSLSGLESYMGVEPDPGNRETLTTTMIKECPKLKLQIVPEPVGVWPGPSEPMDLVLAINVFYHFVDCVEAVKELYSWVRPGGVLIIGHNYNDLMYADVAKEAGLGGDYWMSNLIEDLKQADLNHFKEYKMMYTFDMGSSLNEDMVKFLYKNNILQGNCSDEDVQKCFDIFKKRFESTTQPHTPHNGIILLEKLQ